MGVILLIIIGGYQARDRIFLAEALGYAGIGNSSSSCVWVPFSDFHCPRGGAAAGETAYPFEFILIFYLGGLTLTGMVGTEVSLTNAFCQILTIAMCHYLISLARQRSSRVAQILDGTPLMLMEGKRWRSNTMSRMGIQDDDVMAMARDQGLKTLDEIDTATLERNGEISIIPQEDE